MASITTMAITGPFSNAETPIAAQNSSISRVVMLVVLRRIHARATMPKVMIAVAHITASVFASLASTPISTQAANTSAAAKASARVIMTRHAQ